MKENEEENEEVEVLELSEEEKIELEELSEEEGEETEGGKGHGYVAKGVKSDRIINVYKNGYTVKSCRWVSGVGSCTMPGGTQVALRPGDSFNAVRKDENGKVSWFEICFKKGKTTATYRIRVSWYYSGKASALDFKQMKL